MAERLAIGVAWILVAILLAAFLAATGIALRRVVLGRGGGTVECGLRRGQDQGWHLGLAAYRPGELLWYRALGIRLRPDEVFARRGLQIVARRRAEPSEVASLGCGAVVVECEPGDAGLRIELAMSADALTGFLAWVEAAPPGPVSMFAS